MRMTAEVGFFGNIWVRQNVIHKAGESCEGHKHHFDHVSLLTKGSAEVEVEGHPPRSLLRLLLLLFVKNMSINLLL